MDSATPLYPQAALGYRVWQIEQLHGRPTLVSLYKNSVWRPGANDAACLVVAEESHSQPPVPGCGCGLNAYHALEDALTQANGWKGQPIVLGAVAAKGKIEVHIKAFERRWLKCSAFCV